jgi:hypothetical protein
MSYYILIFIYKCYPYEKDKQVTPGSLKQTMILGNREALDARLFY